MENRIILVDTSIFIDFLRKEKKEKSTLWSLREKYTCTMSTVTLFELLAGAKTEKQRTDVVKLCKWIDVLNFDTDCAEFAGQIFRDLRSRNALIEFRDIFIAATAIHHQFEVATFNVDHFERVNNISLMKGI